MKGFFYMLGSDYPVQLWMRPIARPKTREGSWETSTTLGNQLLKAHWLFVMGIHPWPSGCFMQQVLPGHQAQLHVVHMQHPSRKELQREESPFSCHPPCEWLSKHHLFPWWLTQSGNAFKSVHSHQGAVETFWQWSVGLNTCTTWHQVSHLQYKLPLGGPWRPFLSGIVVKQ